MNTLLLDARLFRAAQGSINKAAGVLQKGGLVAFPTETVYGLGANALERRAVTRIFEAKGRPQDNPLIVHIAELTDLYPLVQEVPQPVRALAAHFWPGPLTVVLPRSDKIPPEVSGGLDTVAVRVPNHPVARALIQAARVPVAAPSANRSGRPSPTTATHCMHDLAGRVEIVLDGGRCSLGVESTVLSFTGERPRLLRPGAVTLEQMRAVIGDIDVDPTVLQGLEQAEPAASPGTKYTHYAPDAQLTIVHGDRDAVRKYLADKKGDGVMVMGFTSDTAARYGVPVLAYGDEDDPATQTERLYAALRELDKQGAKTVYVRVPEPTGLGLAVYNRLLRAAGFREVRLEG